MSGDIGILLLRVVVGLLVMGHGSQKLFGWFDGPGLEGFSGHLASMGMKMPRYWAIVAALSEFGGGLLLLVGFLTPIGELAISAVMLMAIFQVHWPKVWAQEGGFEYPLTLLAVALTVSLSGPGLYSLDAMLRSFLPTPATLILGLVAVGFGVTGAIATSEKPAPAALHDVDSERRAA